MIYESQNKRKKVFEKLSKVIDDDDDDDKDEKPEEMSEEDFGEELNNFDIMPMSGKNGHRDQIKDNPFVTEGLEDRLCTILETFVQRNVKPHSNSKGAGALGQGPDAPGPVSKVPVLGHSSRKDQKGGTEQSRRRGQLDTKHSAGDQPEDNEEDNEKPDEIEQLKKDLGMNGQDETKQTI